MAGELPRLLRRYLDRAVPTPTPLPSRTRITQECRMRMKPAGRWMRFTAVQDFRVRRVGFSPARPRGIGKTTVDTPWRGKVGDYATVGGVRIPRRAEVAWELPDGPFTYWEGTVTGLEAS